MSYPYQQYPPQGRPYYAVPPRPPAPAPPPPGYPAPPSYAPYSAPSQPAPPLRPRPPAPGPPVPAIAPRLSFLDVTRAQSYANAWSRLSPVNGRLTCSYLYHLFGPAQNLHGVDLQTNWHNDVSYLLNRSDAAFGLGRPLDRRRRFSFHDASLFA